MYSPDDVAQKNIRIMVVDDADSNRDILTAILAERGWQTVTATDGEAALAILAHDPDFQIILMDIGLPGIDGVEATRRIKENPATRAIPVIALTAQPVAERERLLAAGLDGYAEKNFDPDQLFSAIEKQLFPLCENRPQTGPPLAASGEHLDLDFATLLTIYADEATLCRIATAFFADTGKTLKLLNEAMAMGNNTDMLACCHSLSGLCAIFTAKKLGAAVKELEVCIRQGGGIEAYPAWHRMLAAHESLRQFVTRRCNLTLQSE